MPPPSSLSTRWGSCHAVALGAEPGDGDLDDVTAGHELRRVEADPDAGGGAGGDDVAGQQGDPGGDGGEQLRDVEDQVGHRRGLPRLAVDPALHHQRGHVRHLVGADRIGAHRAVGVQRLADQPLLVDALQVPGGEVVDDRVAPDVVERPLPADAAPAAADDHAQLGLVVQFLRHPVVRVDVVERAGDRGGGLREDHRRLGQRLGAVGAVVAGAAELHDVFAVVLADGEDVPPRHRDGGQQPHAVQRLLRLAGGLLREDGAEVGPALDQLQDPGAVGQQRGEVADHAAVGVDDTHALVAPGGERHELHVSLPICTNVTNARLRGTLRRDLRHVQARSTSYYGRCALVRIGLVRYGGGVLSIEQALRALVDDG